MRRTNNADACEQHDESQNDEQQSDIHGLALSGLVRGPVLELPFWGRYTVQDAKHGSFCHVGVNRLVAEEGPEVERRGKEIEGQFHVEPGLDVAAFHCMLEDGAGGCATGFEVFAPE